MALCALRPTVRGLPSGFKQAPIYARGAQPAHLFQGMPDQWLLREAGLWNSLASLPVGNVFRHVALDACPAAIDHRNWAQSMFKA